MSLAYSILLTVCVAEAKSRCAPCSRSNPMLSPYIILCGVDDRQTVTSVRLTVDGSSTKFVHLKIGLEVCPLTS